MNLPHHITQRGNYQQKIFADNSDRNIYLSFVLQASEKYNLTILAYCLMDNHVHFIAIPHEEYSMAKTFNTAHMRYSQYYNKKQSVRGHLWQGRFYSCVLDNTHLLVAVRYVERNPVRANKVTNPWDWQYSSAKAHIGSKDKFIASVKQLFDYVELDTEQWKTYIGEKDNEPGIEELKKHTMSGRPLGGIEFVERLEKRLDRRLHALSWGRPEKVK